jgi:hypothetical protein
MGAEGERWSALLAPWLLFTLVEPLSKTRKLLDARGPIQEHDSRGRLNSACWAKILYRRKSNAIFSLPAAADGCCASVRHQQNITAVRRNDRDVRYPYAITTTTSFLLATVSFWPSSYP